METKLTLRIDKNAIERAKIYARNHKISLSKMIESYFNSLTETNENSTEIKISELVESISGVIQVPNDFDDKNEYRNYLDEKYIS
jgi:hypothetical protein